MRYIIDDETLAKIADAIRSKNDTDELITVSTIADHINAIRTTVKPILEGLSVMPTGQEIVEIPPFGSDGFGIVTVYGDENLVPENIRKGVTIYNVEGLLESAGELDTSDATATADDIVDAATAYVNGVKVIGTHVCRADPIVRTLYVNPTGEEYVITPEEGEDGFNEVVVEGDENLNPYNILAGITIYGVSGMVAFQSKEFMPCAEDTTYYPDYGYTAFEDVTVRGDYNLVPENIVKGVTIFDVKGEALSESDFVETKLQTKEVTPGPDEIVLEPDSNYYGFSEVTIEGDENLTPENIVDGVTIFGVKGTAILAEEEDDDYGDGGNRMYVMPAAKLLFEIEETE